MADPGIQQGWSSTRIINEGEGGAEEVPLQTRVYKHVNMRISNIRGAELYLFPNTDIVLQIMNRLFKSAIHIINLVKVLTQNKSLWGRAINSLCM